MKTKYPTPKPHVHAELIKAWADGALIKYYSDFTKCYSPTHANNPCWSEYTNYCIDPHCNYAKAKIAELGGNDMVELYLYWLDGGEITTESHSSLSCYPTNKDIDDVFTHFKSLLKDSQRYGTKLCKKKRMVKQVLWVTFPDGCDESWAETSWLPVEQCHSKNWHKVPSCTREIEAND